MTAPITYPDGSVLVSTALTVSPDGGTLGALLQPLTMGMLGLDKDAHSAAVRITWPSEGQPFSQPNEDVCYLRFILKDDPYDKVRELTNLPASDPDLNEQWNYTRVWSIGWIFYGPNSVDRARAVRSALQQIYFTDALALSQLFPVSEIASPMRVPENIGGQWFERADLECDMYEYVTENIQRQTVASAEVLVYSDEVKNANRVTLVNEPFSGPDQNPLNPLLWAPDSSGFWPPPRILNNGVTSQVSGVGLATYIGITWPDDQWLEFEIDEFATGDAWLIARSTLDESTCYGVEITSPVTSPDGFGPGCNLSVQVYVGNAFVAVAVLVDMIITISRRDRFLFALQGKTLSVFQNGLLIASTVDGRIASGAAGIFVDAGNPNTLKIVNFKGGGFDASPNGNLVADLTVSS